jgi:hypothetical protein
VPADIGKLELEEYRLRLQRAMDAVHENAGLRAVRKRQRLAVPQTLGTTHA